MKNSKIFRRQKVRKVVYQKLGEKAEKNEKLKETWRVTIDLPLLPGQNFCPNFSKQAHRRKKKFPATRNNIVADTGVSWKNSGGYRTSS